MTKLRMPEKRRATIELLARAPRESIDELFGLLAALPFRLDIHERVEEVAKKSTKFAAGEAVQIVNALMGLFGALTPFDGTLDEFVDQIVYATERGGEGENLLSEDESLNLRQNLNKLLRVPSLSTTARAIAEIVDNVHTLSNSRISTDIRPIFDADKFDSISAAIIIHTLKLDYYEGNESKSFGVAMDEDDLSSLLLKLQNAKVKAATLRRHLASTSINVPEREEK